MNNPLITSFHPWIGSNPIQYFNELEQSALKWNILSKISTVASAAISFSLIAASFFINVPISISLLGCVVLTPGLSFAASYFQEIYTPLQFELDRELPVAEEFKKIQGWTDLEILTFLQAHNIERPATSLPLCEMLPVIARFNAKSKEAQDSAEDANKLLRSIDIPDREFRLWHRNKGWNTLEQITMPALLEAAFALQILKNPTMQEHFLDHFKMTKKTFDERHFDRIIDKNDAYLLHPTITFETLFETLDPKSLNKMIYG